MTLVNRVWNVLKSKMHNVQPSLTIGEKFVPINKAERRVRRNGKLLHLAKLDSAVTMKI